MGRLTLWDNGKLGLRQRSRVTERSPMGRLALWDNGKLGLGCIDRGKKHNLGQPKESNGKAYVVGQREAGTQVYRSGTDGVVRGHWTCYLQMVCGMINVYVLYVYSTEPALSAELC